MSSGDISKTDSPLKAVQDVTPKYLEAGHSSSFTTSSTVVPPDASKRELATSSSPTDDDDDPYAVTFSADGKDPWHPYNWPLWKRVWMLVFTSCGGLVTLMSGSMLAPALPAISSSLSLSPESAEVSLSIYVLAFAFGPLVLSPLTEVWGRRPVWLASGAWFVLWNAVCGATDSAALMVVARLLAGLGASADFAAASPCTADVWRPEDRGKSLALSRTIPLLGPAIGPVVAGFVTDALGWRWLFYVVSIFHGALVLLGLFSFFESYHPLVLEAKARHLRRETGRPFYAKHGGPTGSPSFHQPLGRKLRRALSRPFRMLARQPIIQVLSVFMAYNFGVLYVALSSYAQLYIDVYGDSPAGAGLHYIAIVVGYVIAAWIGAPLTDGAWAYLKKRRSGQGQGRGRGRGRGDGGEGENNNDGGGEEGAGEDGGCPEFRVPVMVPGLVLMPAGLLWYGWSAAGRLHWAMVDVGAGLWGCGVILGTSALQAYVMDAYPRHVSSSAAASQFLRFVFGFAFPVFAPRLYRALGYGWGNTLLAAVFVVFMGPSPWLLWRYGARLRAMRAWDD